LAVAAAVFLGWLGFLIYLATATKAPVIVSHPQLLVSTLDVIGEVSQQADGKPSPEVKVVEVHYPPGNAGPQPGTTLRVANLPELGSGQGWQGPGLYILPLVPSGQDEYAVPRTPPSPGFDAGGPAGRPHIYPATPQTRSQLNAIAKPAP
jgi:hypothetical protein